MQFRWVVAGLMTAGALLLAAGAPVAWSQTEYLVSPRDTDEAIDSWLAPHVVEIDRTARAEDLLFLHFPGSYDVPSDSKLILKQAARLGYPAIGLRYPNSWTVYTLCAASSDPECFEKVRLEILDGVGRTDKVEISAANSIANRVVKLLAYLVELYPDDGWDRFLGEDGMIIWEKVVVSGHSQGAGHAAMIAKVYRVSQVGMFAGPPDYSMVFGTPPDWLSSAGETPQGRFFGFGHSDDGLVPERQLIEIWTALGMSAFGPPASVDDLEPPFERSHMLFSSAEPAALSLIANHNAVVVDRETPKREDGTPLFDVVWDVMCFSENQSGQVRRSGRRVRPR